MGIQLPKEAQPPFFGPCLLWPNGRPSQLLLSTCLLYLNMYAAPKNPVYAIVKVPS